jgi:hypothetical protein
MDFKLFNTRYWQEYIKNSKFSNTNIYSQFGDVSIECVPGQEINIYTNIEKFDKEFEIKLKIYLKNLYIQQKIKKLNINNHNLVKHYGFLPIVTYNQVINIDEFKFSKLKKGTKYCINKAQKENTYCLIDSTIDEKKIRYCVQKFKECYFDVAGKIVRPPKLFDIISYFIIRGNAILFMSEKAYNLVYIYENQAYYGMSCQKHKSNIGYLFQHHTIHELKLRGIKYYILGEQSYNNLYHNPSEKDLNISKFKRSFGGFISPHIRGEVFLNKKYMNDVFEKRLRNYEQNNSWGISAT